MKGDWVNQPSDKGEEMASLCGIVWVTALPFRAECLWNCSKSNLGEDENAFKPNTISQWKKGFMEILPLIFRELLTVLAVSCRAVGELKVSQSVT